MFKKREVEREGGLGDFLSLMATDSPPLVDTAGGSPEATEASFHLCPGDLVLMSCLASSFYSSFFNTVTIIIFPTVVERYLVISKPILKIF